MAVIPKLGFGTAGIFQTVSASTPFFASVFGSYYFDRLSPTQWVQVSTICSVLSYCTMYIAYWLPKEYFLHMTIIYGIFTGFASGIGWSVVFIVPYRWLDSTRALLGPLLLWGSPIGGFIMGPVTHWLISKYDWSGTLLIFIGIVSHEFIVALLFEAHPYDPFPAVELTKKKNIRAKFNDIKNNDCAVRLLLLMFVLSAFVILPILTQITNIVTEYGVESDHVAYLWSLHSLCDFVMRPIWGQASRFCSVSALIIVDMLLLLLLSATLIFFPSLVGFYVAFAIFGVAMAGYAGLKGVWVAEIVGVQQMSSYMVFEQMIIWPGALVVPNLLVALSVKKQDYSIIPKSSAIASIVAIILAASIARTLTKREHREDRRQIVQ